MDRGQKGKPKNVTALTQKAPKLKDVFADYYHEILRIVRSKVGNGPPDPEDIVQQAFANYAATDDRGAIRNPAAFLTRAATNLIADHSRRSATKLNVSATDEGEDFFAGHHDELSPEIVVIGRESLHQVISALEELPRRQRRFLLLNRLDGISYADISRQNGVSAATVRREVEAGVAYCRKALANKTTKDDA